MDIPKDHSLPAQRHGRGYAADLRQQIDRDEVLSQIKTADNLRAYVERITERRGRNNYVCPLCGSGDGPRKTAAFNVTGSKWKCFSCQEGGDILDLIGKVEGIEGYTKRLRRAAEVLGIDTRAGCIRVTPERLATPSKIERAATDYDAGRATERAYIESCKRNIGHAADYLAQRGYTIEQARDLGFGYDPARRRLVVPWAGSDYYHIDRDITGAQARKYEYPKADEVGPMPLFNPGALDEPAFVVVEGPLDAWAVMRCGRAAAVALGGTGHRQLVAELQVRHYQGCVVLMLDNDRAGKAAQDKLAKALEDAGIAHLSVAYPEDWPYKDVDEYVRGDPEEAVKWIGSIIGDATEEARNADRNPNMMLHDPADVAARIYLGEDADAPIPTGLKSLDRLVGGGLMRGLYVIGATSSFGKTTITLQIADAVAAQGHPVLFVTIEQSAQEIVTKSLSRLTHDTRNWAGWGLTSQEITASTARKSWGQDKWEALASAAEAYSATIAPTLRILEGVRRPSVADVRAAAEAMTAEFGQAPVIFVDYLQLLASKSERDNDKAAVDYNVTALRQFARDLKTPVWCVATLNRESYSGPVDFDSYKESGSIEYGADYLFGLQPRGIAAEVESVKSAVEKKLRGNAFVAMAKRDDPRKVELTILKNRQGMTTGTAEGIPLTYWPRTNIFTEA